MNRRIVLKSLVAGTIVAIGGELTLRHESGPANSLQPDVIPDATGVTLRNMPGSAPDRQVFIDAFNHDYAVDSVRNDLDGYITRMKAFDEDHSGDLFISDAQQATFASTFSRLERVQHFVGHGNFNVISFDEMLAYAKRYRVIGVFQTKEIEFLESIFFNNAKEYGFYGEKVTTDLTTVVPQKERYKVPNTGHYVYRGESFKQYQRIQQDMGDQVVLTSGIRSIIKQSHLFLAKTILSGGNLSRASRSLAPPGHSFHGVGDFDVGKIGYGRKNFTTDFARTSEFARLVELGYVQIRYPEHNLQGVRYEPWHIKVV